jgi:hypothetical protein
LADATGILLAVLTVAHKDIIWVSSNGEGDCFAEALTAQCIFHGFDKMTDAT